MPGPERRSSRATYILVWNDLDVLHVAGGLEYLAQNILRDPLVEAAHIERPLVRLGGGAASEAARTAGRQDIIDARHGGGDCRRNRVCILRDVERRRRHVGRVGLAILPILVARSASIRLRWRR